MEIDEEWQIGRVYLTVQELASQPSSSWLWKSGQCIHVHFSTAGSLQLLKIVENLTDFTEKTLL